MSVYGIDQEFPEGICLALKRPWRGSSRIEIGKVPPPLGPQCIPGLLAANGRRDSFVDSPIARAWDFSTSANVSNRPEVDLGLCRKRSSRKWRMGHARGAEAVKQLPEPQIF